MGSQTAVGSRLDDELDRPGWPWSREGRLSGATSTSSRKTGTWPRISIVTPSFNQGAFIEETIRSVLLQDYPNLEYIIIDGGSTDGTLDILKRYAPRLTYWISEPDGGQAHALNKGFARATGSIFAYLNSDDLYEPGALHFAAEVFEKTRADFLFGRNQVTHSSRSRKTRIRNALRPIPHPLIVGHPRYDIAQDASFWRGDSSPRFDEAFQFCLDVEFFLRECPGRRIVMTDRVLSYFREHDASKSALMQKVGVAERAVLERRMEGQRVSGWRQAGVLLGYWWQTFVQLVPRILGVRSDLLFSYRHPSNETLH
jgi:glycosyltransferase involved in cell wall biosynthesis